MTKAKPTPTRVVDAIRAALKREDEKRSGSLQPIEIVKVALSAYQTYYAVEQGAGASVESDDRSGLRRGTQASIDRLLFNVNYWLSAYEDRIVDACARPDDARNLLRDIAAWNSHTMKLNTLSPNEVTALFERFCPPFSANKRRGGANGAGAGKGPVHDFKRSVRAMVANMAPAQSAPLELLVAEIDDEARAYERYAETSSIDAYYDLLPAWCLQDQIALVRGSWWNDPDVMELIASELFRRFRELGFAQPLCSYFHDAMRESIDNYTRTIDTEESPFRSAPIPQLIELVKSARASHPDSEIEGYGHALPSWLDSKEQLIWNTIVCAVYGPMHTRPLLADNLDALPVEGRPASSDVITELAECAFQRYLVARTESGTHPEFHSFEKQPRGLRESGLARIESIPAMLDVLGYRIVPIASCYPEQRIKSLTPSEIECLAILEHRRWLAERAKAGWEYASEKNIASKRSPYLIDWEKLPDRAREWNRSSARDIPALLENVGLAISR